MSQGPSIPADSVATRPLRRRVLAFPTTGPGWVSVGLGFMFVGFLSGGSRLIVPLVSGLAAGVLAWVALLKGERLILVILAFLLGVLLLFLVIAMWNVKIG